MQKPYCLQVFCASLLLSYGLGAIVGFYILGIILVQPKAYSKRYFAQFTTNVRPNAEEANTRAK